MYYLRYDHSQGYETAVGRPVVILSSQEYIDTRMVVQVAFVSTSPRRENQETNITVDTRPRTSYVICNQVNTIDKSRLELDRCMYTLTDDEMQKVDEALLKVFGFDKPKAVEKVEEVPKHEDAFVLADLEVYKKLYEKTLEKLIESKLEYDDLRVKMSVLGRKATVVEEKPVMQMTKEDLKPEMTDEEIMSILEDAGMKVSKKKKVEIDAPVQHGGRAKLNPKAKPVNVNTGTVEDFKQLGMSDRTSKEIVRYRKKYGRFTRLEELLDVRQFGKGCLAVFGPMLRV